MIRFALVGVDVQQITGTARSVRQLLSQSRYGLDFYQREYSWREAQVGELIDDLTVRFFDEYDEAHERQVVAAYRPYFLGPIVTALRDGVRYLVDGQQRITTLSLLLIYVRHRLLETDPEEAHALDSLIYSSAFGKKTFNLDVDEREKCLQAIFDGEEYDADAEPESVRNLWDRYQTIVDRFPDDLHGDPLPYFADWLQHGVILVDIGAPDQDMALEIFETMNDRGLRLSSTDMLKSFLLARAGDENVIKDLNSRWRRRVGDLKEWDADADFFKAWLRAKYAETQRERKKKAAPRDFEIIGTAFHKWVRDKQTAIGLGGGSDYRRFVEDDFLKLSKRYLELLDATWELTPGLEAVFCNDWNGFSLQLPVILAAVTPEDDDETFKKKSALVAGALDIFIARRMVNHRNFGYSTVVYTMFNLIKELRDKPIEALRQVLTQFLEKEWEELEGYWVFVLTKRNRRHVHYLLARITAWIDSELGTGMTVADYLNCNRSRKHPFEVEHIWADKFERHADGFRSPDEFENHRNRFGDLLLLPKDFNASYGAMPYDQKVKHYLGQNILAKSLHPRAYQHNPSFARLRATYDLAFKPYAKAFTKDDIVARQALYLDLAEIIWDPARIGLSSQA